jgi:hypothetical protein
MSEEEKLEKDSKWYDEKNQEGSRVSVNHRGLMPRCYNCNGTYQRVVSDKEGFAKAIHPKNSCPFKKTFYGKDDLDNINQIRVFLNDMLVKRSE